MITRLLVPLDGSALAEVVIPWVKVFARLTNATVILTQVVEPIEPIFELAGTWEFANQAAERQEEAEQVAQRYLTRATQQLSDEGITVQTRVLVGSPTTMILQAAGEADLVIMATHGRTGLKRWVFGSVTDRVLHEATTPILLVRAGTDRPAIPAIHRLLVPLDGSPLAEQALPIASEMAKHAGAELLLIHSIGWVLAAVADYPHFFINGKGVDQFIAQVRDQAHAYLTKTAHRLAQQSLSVETELRHEHAAEAILISASAHQSDLIVMTTHGRGGLGRWVYGSVADRVLRAATTPILLIRAHESTEVTTTQPAAVTVPQ